MIYREARMSATAGRTDHVSPRQATVEAAERRLSRSPYIELRCISVDLREGVLILRGRVPSYYLKQIAQCLVDCLPGVQKIDNHLEVVAPHVVHGAGRGAQDSFPPAKPRPR